MRKYVLIIGDGMADRPIEELGGLTPLKKAFTPNMDKLAAEGIVGRVRTIPEGFHPGSDVANLSIFGYDPARYYTGRAPLEAASIGVGLNEDDAAYRCNLVTLKFGRDKNFSPIKTFGDKAIMDDYSSGHITTEEAGELMAAIQNELGNKDIAFYPGVNYRHLMVWKEGRLNIKCVPPHDILERDIADYLPDGEGDNILQDLMRRSVDILERHSVNKERLKMGKKPANSIWLWGQGKKPSIPAYQEKYGLKGALVSPVDLIKGLGLYAGFKILNVPGVTDWLDTNYTGMVEYSLNAISELDFACIHIEAPDEAGHAGNYKDKIRAIEDFDAFVVGKVMAGLKERFREYRILLMPDHATPIEVRTHTEEPVPFAIYDSLIKRKNEGAEFNESITEKKDIMVVEKGYELMDYFIKEPLT